MEYWNEFKEIHVFDFDNSNRIYFNSLIRFGKENVYIAAKSINNIYTLNIFKGCKIVCIDWVSECDIVDDFNIIVNNIERNNNE